MSYFTRLHHGCAEFRREIDPAALTGPLLLVTFCAGILDSTTYYNFGTFASNQTGNTFIFISAITQLHPAKADLQLTGASLLAFLVFAFIFARTPLLGHTARPRKQWWILLSLAVQNFLILLPAVLITSGAVPVRDGLDWLLLGLLGASAGVQVVVARTSGNPEIPSAMLTLPYIDFLIEPQLFGPLKQPDSRSRNIRLMYLGSLIIGGFFGAGLQHAGGTVCVLWVAFGLKMAVMGWVCIPTQYDTSCPPA